MKFENGIEFVNEKPGTVIKHLKNVRRGYIKTTPYSVSLKTGNGADSERIFLNVNNGTNRTFPVRRAFFHKLLNWYKFPVRLLSTISTDTAVSMANDFLLNIRSSSILIKLEDEEALTIVSDRYADLPDLEILELCKDFEISEISRNDFFMRLYSNIKVKTEPVPGDECGFGFNIFNSETGFMALRISHYILRYICTNGASVPVSNNKAEGFIHYNTSKDNISGYIKESLAEIQNNSGWISDRIKVLKNQEPDESLIKKLTARLSGVLGFAAVRKFMCEYREAVENYLNREVMLNVAEQSIGYGNYGQSSGQEYDSSEYSLFNFITSQAKQYNIFTRAQMEQIAGEVFFPKNLITEEKRVR
jgi:hypothetical protein